MPYGDLFKHLIVFFLGLCCKCKDEKEQGPLFLLFLPNFV